MCIKMMYNITTFKNTFQYLMAQFNNAKSQLLLHESNRLLSSHCLLMCLLSAIYSPQMENRIKYMSPSFHWSSSQDIAALR